MLFGVVQGGVDQVMFSQLSGWWVMFGKDRYFGMGRFIGSLEGRDSLVRDLRGGYSWRAVRLKGGVLRFRWD